MTFRAGRRPGDRPFRAYYLPPSCDDESIDLTAAFAADGVAVVSDPKLFKLGEEIWVTFNTGHTDKPNRIFAAQLHPVLSSAYELDLPGRQVIEKNWALFRRDGALHALYSVHPTIVLRAVDRRSSGRIEFEKLGAAAGKEPTAPGALTLGSQLTALDEDGNDFAAVVHRKFYWKRRRTYLGLPARIQFDREACRIAIGHSYLAHSLSALLGDRVRHNPNLQSCTYFSGIMVSDDRAVLGYGINDVAAGFAEISLSALGFDTGARAQKRARYVDARGERSVEAYLGMQ
jgi:hypothetical protein